jgi:hypothetical protein
MNYIQNVSYGPKDDLPEDHPDKFVKGTEFDSEFEEIAAAIATKEDLSNKGQANGYAPLDNSTKVDEEYMYDASDIQKGVAELATSAEAIAGLETDKIITPDTLDDVLTQNAGVLKDLAGFVDPNGDRILFWDDSADSARGATPSTGLSLSGTTLTTDDSAIVHDNLSGFVANEHIDHSSVQVIAGNGLTGGGTITASRTLNVVGTAPIIANADSLTFELSGLTAIEGNAVTGGDNMFIDDGGTPKKMRWQDAGPPVVVDTNNHTPASSQVNRCVVLNSATNKVFTLNTGVGVVGNFFILTGTGAGIWTFAGSATRLGANGTSGMAQQYSVVMLLCVSTDTWIVFGDAQ